PRLPGGAVERAAERRSRRGRRQGRSRRLAEARAGVAMTAGLEGRPTTRPPISVNGVVIERTAIAQEAQHHPAASPGESMRKAAEALVVRELLLQEARRQ